MKTIFALAAALALGGCATLTSLDSEVSTYSRWPAGRTPSTYVFERLPSQQTRPERQQRLEEAARPALETAGFTPAPDAAPADVNVQVSARITPIARTAFADPLWWGPGWHRPFASARGGPVFWGPAWGWGWGWGGGPRFDDHGYEREVAVLIRDRRTGEPLYEARAVNDGLTPMAETALPAMFAAALRDFPNGGPNPRRVSVDIGP